MVCALPHLRVWRDAYNRARAFKLCPHEPNDRILYYLPKRVLISEIRLLVWLEGPGLDVTGLDADADQFTHR